MKTLIFYLMLLVPSLEVNAQEIGISPIKIWTQNKELQNPFGVGAHLSCDIWRLRVKAEYIYARSERSYYGYVVYGFMAYPSSLVEEHVRSTSYFSAFEFSINIPSIIQVDDYGLNIGFGISFDNFNVIRSGLASSETAELDDAKFGPLFAISISRGHIFWQPITIELLYKIKGLSNTMSVTDIEQPFVDLKRIQSLQLNVIYSFHDDASPDR
jgi:hypothetical protein